jgi:large subunit ribosomal protein L1
MAAQRYCPSCLTKASPTTLFRAAPRAIAPPSFLRPFHTSSPLAAVQSANAAKYKRKDQQTTSSKKKKKASTNYDTPDLRDALQFSLVDAMRYGKF